MKTQTTQIPDALFPAEEPPMFVGPNMSNSLFLIEIGNSMTSLDLDGLLTLMQAAKAFVLNHPDHKAAL